MHKAQLENDNRALKEQSECCERERFELQEQLIDMEHQLHTVRDERNQQCNRVVDVERALKAETVRDCSSSMMFVNENALCRLVDSNWRSNSKRNRIN